VKKRYYYLAFAVLLALTSSFVAHFAHSSEQRISMSGGYYSVVAVSLQQPPDPNEYIVLNYTHRSDIFEYDLVHILENYDDFMEKNERLYREGRILESDYQWQKEIGPDGRMTDEVTELLEGKDFQYILWQPQNRWFNVTFGCTMDFVRPDSMSPVSEASCGAALTVGWIALAVCAIRRRKSPEFQA